MQDMNPEARSLIGLARQARTPTAEDKARVRAAIGLGVAAAAVPTGIAVATAKAGGMAGLVGGFRAVLSAALVASVSVGGGVYYWRTMRPAVPRPVEVRAPLATDRPAAAFVTPEPALSTPLPGPAAPSAVGRPAEARLAPSSAPPDPLLAEVTLLRKAQRAWQGGKPQVALDLAQRHAQTYPHSQLAVERDAVRVFALCALGRTVEAQSLASELFARAPGSPLRTSLEESCAGAASSPK